MPSRPARTRRAGAGDGRVISISAPAAVSKRGVALLARRCDAAAAVQRRRRSAPRRRRRARHSGCWLRRSVGRPKPASAATSTVLAPRRCRSPERRHHRWNNGEQSPSLGYGDIRGWDAHREAALPTPRAGEPGADTGKARAGRTARASSSGRSSRSTSSAASSMRRSARRRRTTGRSSANLYGTIVALDAATGRLKWYRQLVHHDLWTTTCGRRRAGRRPRTAAPFPGRGHDQMGLVFASTASPASRFGVEERAVPQSTVPGEATG